MIHRIFPSLPAVLLALLLAGGLAGVQAATPTELAAGYAAQAGKHAATGKTIGALAPAFNADRFTDAAKAEKWFRRNCKDVAGRECTAGEKADVLAWLLTLKK